MLKKVLDFLRARLREPSTLLGAAVLGYLFGVRADDVSAVKDTVTEIADTIIKVGAAAAMMLPDPSRGE